MPGSADIEADVASAIEENLSETATVQDVEPEVEPTSEIVSEPPTAPADEPVIANQPTKEPFSMFGGKAETSAAEERSGSMGRIAMSAQDLPSGVYFVRVRAAGAERTFKLPLGR